MAHPRKLIRAAVKAHLLNATAAQDRVFDTMTPPVALTALVEEGPFLLAYCRNESIRHEDFPTAGADGSVRRRLDLQIEAMVAGAINIDDALDDMAEQIEALLEDWEIPGFPSARLELKDSEINVTDFGDRILGGIFLTYEIAYLTLYRADASDDWLADDVLSAPRGDAPELIVDDDGDGLP